MLEAESERPRRIHASPLGEISYRVDADQHIILEAWKGEISVVELRSHWAICLKDPEVLAVKRTLVDLRHCEITFSGQEWFEQLEKSVISNCDANGWVSASSPPSRISTASRASS